MSKGGEQKMGARFFSPTIDSVKRPAWFTYWSYIHFLSGIALYLLFRWIFDQLCVAGGALYSILAAFLVHLAYEFKDWYYSYVKKRGNNSLRNSVGDQLSALLGMVVAWVTFSLRETEPLQLGTVTIVWIHYVTTYMLARLMNFEKDH